MNKIAVLTSGGDAPGMNPAVRAVVRTARKEGMVVFGVEHGYHGLMYDTMHEMDLRDVSDIIQRGGTKLFSARAPEFRTDEGMDKAYEVCKKHGIEGIVVIGGDGSFRGARDFSNREKGVPCIAIPGTIDNDIACCDYTIGYDTCMNTIVEMVDRIRDTTESHDRCSVVEVMGRSAGYLALYSGIAVGATVIIIPEKPYDFERDVIQVMQSTIKTGKHHFVIVVAEGVGGVEAMAKEIESRLGVESRAVILGHVQRGGSPTARDRIVASIMGNKAVKLLKNGSKSRVVAMQKEEVIDYDINEALSMKKHIDMELYKISGEISI